MADDLILNETDRQKLDGIVQQMIANKEADADIQFVVNDFKSKYGQKKSPSVTTPASPAQPTKDSATVSGQQSGSGVGVSLPKITLGEESLRGGVAKSDVIEKPKMEDAMLLEQQQRGQFKIDESARIKKDITKKIDAANKSAKEQSLKASIVNYLQKLTDHFGGTVAQEGEPTGEPADIDVDIYEPIRLQTETLQPDMVSENVDPQLRERVVMKNSKLAKSATEEFNVAKPYIEGITKLSQVKQKLGQAQAEYDAATNVVMEQRAAIDADLKRARALNPEKLNELGFTEGFEKSLEQTTIANTIADMYMKGDDDKVKNSLESLYADSVLFPQEETTGGMIGGMIGGQVKPLAVGFGLGALNPALGVVGGSAYYGRMNMGSSMIEAYTTARAQGMDADDAYEIATKQAKVGFATGAAEGLVGMVTMGGKPVQSAVTETFKRAVKSTLKEAGVDGAIAGGLKAVENVSMQKLGLDVETDSGVMQEMAAEALFGTAMHMAMFGGKKVLGANYGTIINGIAKMPFNEIQAKVNEAVKAGVLDAAKGEQFLTEVRVSSEAQERLKGVDIPEKKQDTVIELQKQINQTEKDMENASPAVVPALEKKIEDLSAEMQVEAAIPLTAKEKTELNKLQTARDENKAYDKDRLKVLEKRQKAAEKVAEEKLEAEEKAKEETIKRQQEEKAAEEQAVEQPEAVAEQQVVETPTETVTETAQEQVPPAVEQPTEVATGGVVELPIYSEYNQNIPQTGDNKELSTENSIIKRIDKLDPYEADGYIVDRLRALKELLYEFPEKAKIAFDILDQLDIIYPKDDKMSEFRRKKPLSALQSIFYNDYKSVDDFIERYIDLLKSGIKSKDEYISSLGNSKSDVQSKKLWEKSISETKNEIKRVEKLLGKKETSAPETQATAEPSVDAKMPKEIQDLYLKKGTLRMTIHALKMQMGGKGLVGKAKAEYEKAVSEFNAIESQISEYEQSQTTKKEPVKETQSETPKKEEPKKEKTSTTSNDYANYLLDLIQQKQQELGWKDAPELRKGLAKAFEQTLKERGENKAIGDLETTYVQYIPERVRADAYQVIRKNYEKQKTTQTGIETPQQTEATPEQVQNFEAALSAKTAPKRDKALQAFGDNQARAKELIDNYDTNIEKLKAQGIEPTGTKAEVLADMLSGKYDEQLKETSVAAPDVYESVEATAKALEGINEKKISEKVNQAYLDYAKKVQSLKDKINNLRKQEGDSDRVEKMMEDFFNMRDIERQLKTLSEQGALNMTVEETDIFLDDIKSGLGKTKYTRGKIIGKNNELGDLFAAEGDGVLYRSVTLDDWERIQKQGFVDSDKRGAISEQEGTNLAIDPRTSLYYLPHNQKGVIIAIDPKGVDLFMIKNDDYLRTNSKIPISNVVKVSEVIGAGDISGKYIPSNGKKQLSEAYHRAKADGTNPELVKAVEDLLGKPSAAKEPTQATAQVEQAAENETMVGKTVTFEHAGSEKSGVVKSVDAKGNLEVEGIGANKGVKYTVKKADVVSETQEDVAVAKQEAQKENEELGKKINTVIQKAIKKQPTDAKKVIKNMVGFQQIADLPNRLFQNYVANKVRKYEDALAKALQKGSVSQNAAWRNIADFISSYSRGAMDTMEYSEAKRQKLTGGINKAKQDAEDLHGQMWDLIGGDVDSADRVHQVLDPDLRQTGLKYGDLTDAEKDLHDLLKSINEYTHNQNFLLGKISKETYDKYKGKYIGREYDFDKLYDQKIGGKTLREILGIYKQRQEVDAEKTLASIKDPIYLTLRRFMQTGQNMAVNEYAHWLYRNYRQGNAFGNAEMISNTERDGFIKLGQGFGALSDKWVARSIAEDFKGFQFTNDFMQLAYDLTKAYDGLPPRQFMKELLTVFNPQVQIGNITSNAVFSWLGGVDLPTYLSKAKEAYGEIKNRGQVYRDLQNEGLIGVDFVSTDLKPMQPQIGGQPENAFRKVERGVREFYQGVDDAAKIQLYLSLKDMGYSHKEAVQTVFESLQNYQNTGRIWDLASKTPIVGNAFIKFTPEMLRLLKNGMTRRPLHTLALISLLSSMPKVLGKMFGNDDEEIDAAGRQKGIPKIMIPYTDLEIPLSWRLGDKRVNIARYLMPMYMYDVGGESKKATDLVNKFIPYQLKQTEEGGLTPVNVQDPFVAPLWGILTNKDFRDKPIVEETDDATDATIKRLRYGVRGYGGFYANLVDDIFSTSITGEDYYGRRKDALDVALNVLIKIETFDDERLKQGIIMEFDGYERLAQKIYTGYAKKRKKLDSEIEEIAADKNMSKERKKELIAKKKAKLVDVSENVLEDIADIQEQQLKATEYYRNLSRKQPYKDIASEFRNTERAINKIERRIDGKFKD